MSPPTRILAVLLIGASALPGNGQERTDTRSGETSSHPGRTGPSADHASPSATNSILPASSTGSRKATAACCLLADYKSNGPAPRILQEKDTLFWLDGLEKPMLTRQFRLSPTP